MSLFGNTSGQSNDAPKSAAPAQPSIFGGASSGTSASPFGQLGATSTSGFQFGTGGPMGGEGNSNGASSPAPAATSSLFGGSQAAKPAEQKPMFGSSTPAAGSGGAMFGGGNAQSAGGLFGSGGSGSRPASSGGGGGALFGANASKPAPAGNLFGNSAAAPSSSAANSPATAPAFPSGGGLFGSKTPAAASTPSAQPTSPFGSNNTTSTGPALTATPAKPLFSPSTSTTPAGAPPAEPPKPAGGLFGNLNNKSGDKKEDAPAAGGLFGGGAKPGSMFGAQKPAGGASLFGAPSPKTGESANPASYDKEAGSAKPASSSTENTATSTAAPAGGLFAGLNKPGSSAGTSEPAKPAGALFGSNSTTAGTPTSTAAEPEAPKPASALFGGTAAPASTSATTTAPASTSAAGETKPTESDQNKTGANSTLGASTTGPPSQLAHLKNKTMDEIITRWATDLSKYQKEFKEQAAQVAAWDRMLVENGEKIQDIYVKTFEAEKASGEVERNLAQIEDQQQELENWLDTYERDVDAMFARDIGRNDQLGGPDQEREKTYKLAEKLTDRLDEMGRDLSKMIKEINEYSGTLSKGNKPDDALNQIVRVLNGHLTQLQWIDTNASSLQAKVAAAQKASSSMGSQYGGPGQDAAESFYRSYMGRR